MSFRKINGTSLINVSRNIPPKAPVIVPITIATHIGNPNCKVFSMPTTPNSPNPIASKIKNVLFKLMTYFRKIITKSNANAEIIR